MLAVFRAIDGETARPHAALDLIFETRARAIAKYPVGAGPQRKDLPNDVDGFAQPVRRSERTKVLTAILDDASRDRDSRPGMIGDLGAQVRFVVLKPDVVARLVLLDEIVLEDQRFLFA